MPQPHQPPRQPSNPGIQVAMSNSTVNRFIGGKQPSWMAGAKPVQPTPRTETARPPMRPAAPSEPISSSTPVLPSPAPSDEPSPAFSNARDSPHSRPSPFAEPALQNPGYFGSPQDGQLSRPVTGARFVHAGAPGPEQRQAMDGAPGNAGAVVPQPWRHAADAHPSSTARASALHVGQTSGFAHPTYRVPTPAGLGSGAEQTPATRAGEVQAPQPPASATRPPVVQGPPSKKRRTNYSGSALPFAFLLAHVDAHVQGFGGQPFLTEIERARFQIVRDACAKEDGFYLVVHQLFTIWTLDSRASHQFVACSPSVVDTAFHVITTLLKSNTRLTPAHLDFFAHFPGQVVSVLEFRNRYVDLLPSVEIFLTRLSEAWPSLTALSVTRRFPYLVDELLGMLHCYSPILQVILFTASRRRIGILDGPLGNACDQAFAHDQQAHMDGTGHFIWIDPAISERTLEERNVALIQWYLQLVRKSFADPSTIQPPSPHLTRKPSFASTAAPSPGMPWPQAPRPRAAQSASTPLQSPNFAGHSPHTAPAQLPPSAPQPEPVPPAAVLRQPVPPDLVLQSSRSGSFVMVPAYAAGPPSRDPQNTNMQQFTSHLQTMQDIHLQQERQNLERLQRQRFPGSAPQFPSVQASRMPQVAAQEVLPQASAVAHDLRGVVRRGSSLVQSPLGLGLPNVPFAGSYPAQPQPASPVIRQMPRGTPREIQPGQARPSPAVIIPPRNQVIPRSDYAHDPNDKRAVMMALHQAEVRSPQRSRAEPKRDGERYYQSVRSLAIGPAAIKPEMYIQDFAIFIEHSEYSALCKDSKLPGALLPVSEYFDGSLRYRLRCCRVASDVTAITETDWVTLDNCWPPNIFMKLNDKPLTVRRHTHNGKDLPVELTSLLSPGKNTLKVVVTQPKPQKGSRYFLAVEVVEISSHSAVMERVWESGRVRAEDTLQKIKARLSSSLEDADGVAIVVKDLSVDLADPFSATIFKVPARGATCAHMECFDLETWLSTRPAKPGAKCMHRVGCSCPGPTEPSHPDKWKCPICFRDARPVSLRIDMFLAGVRAKLEKEGKLSVKSILVSADGSWQPVVDSDGEDESTDGEADGASAAVSRKRASVPADTNVIELLDDDD